ncbi:thioredoxin family protein [Uliginosibacterium sp. sgz301328]|uniref:thioredoxin family protein n=1 Tax=Uliginosibacterium sp. sgz301328 TaxID=3243764 RepID=UPI00359DA36F
MSSAPYANVDLSREDVDALNGPVVIEFGTNWCGFCRGAQPAIDMAMDGRDHVTHIKVEDGKGRRLGRSFAVKLWPTLIFMRQGRELARVVRPDDAQEILQALALIDPPGG